MAIRIHYYQDGKIRFLKGLLLEETNEFVKVELDRYIVTINKSQILKMEVSKGGSNDSTHS